MASAKKNTGKLVQTKHGVGYTISSDGLINGKVPVYLSKPGKDAPPRILCDPANIKILGYYD